MRVTGEREGARFHRCRAVKEFSAGRADQMQLAFLSTPNWGSATWWSETP